MSLMHSEGWEFCRADYVSALQDDGADFRENNWISMIFRRPQAAPAGLLPSPAEVRRRDKIAARRRAAEGHHAGPQAPENEPVRIADTDIVSRARDRIKALKTRPYRSNSTQEGYSPIDELWRRRRETCPER